MFYGFKPSNAVHKSSPFIAIFNFEYHLDSSYQSLTFTLEQAFSLAFELAFSLAFEPAFRLTFYLAFIKRSFYCAFVNLHSYLPIFISLKFFFVPRTLVCYLIGFLYLNEVSTLRYHFKRISIFYEIHPLLYYALYLILFLLKLG
ncbi:membrane protein [Candidatus Magnetobacterium bavaricum]|uniref:Membrane protein n=1 Tax=Candidatus Magnetobacterium bavaricum TaxID=29290 RepID=A0A0F3GL83_9BACT|nr:membrane protein [Candidatus Magnetobacterium bavaricum]